MKKKLDIGTLKRVFPYLRPYRLRVACSMICAAITAGVGLLIPIFCGKAIDNMMLSGFGVDFDGVLKYIVYIIVAALSAALAQQLLATSNNKIAYCVSRDLRNETEKKTHRLPISYLDSHPSGDIVSRIIADVDSFSDGLLMGFTQLFTGVITIIGTLSIMLYYNGFVALIVVVLTPLSLFVAGFIAKKTQKYFSKQAKIRGEQTAMINELIDGQRVIQAYSHEDESLAEFDEVNGRLGDAAMKATFFSSLTNPSTRLVNNIVYAGVCLVSAFFVISGGETAITVGELSVFLSYASQYAKPFNEISGVVTEFQNALTCVGRIFEFLDETEEIEAGETEEDLDAKGSVELRDVYFSYTPEKPLIQGVTLDVSPGQRIAIVGPTGCGKTTLINLLMRFYDVNKGAICVDGRDIRTVDRRTLRKNYGMVLQDTWLRSGTIKENIAYGRPDATDDEIIAAAKAAHAHSFIRRLPKGYDTRLGEGGEGLSVGQKQLLCIARVMLCLPPMLILDEATSSIDTRTEIRIQKAFAQMMNGRTSFIVAHRLSTIKEADVILVMKDGNIIEQGSHEKLLSDGGFYATLYNSQYVNV